MKKIFLIIRPVLMLPWITLMISTCVFAWTEPVNISNTAIRSDFPALFIDRNNNVHVAWAEFDLDSPDHIFYCKCEGDSWYPPCGVAITSPYSGYPDIVVDTANRIHIAWYDFNFGEIFWSFSDGDTWSTPFNVSNKPGGDWCPEMVVDSKNKIHMVWHGSGSEWYVWIWYSTYDGTSWTLPFRITLIDTANKSLYPDIAIDSNDRLHVVWMDCASNMIAYSIYDVSSWSDPIQLPDPSSGYSCDPRIAIDSNDYPHVVWQERKDGYHIYYTYYDGSSWSTPCLLSGEKDGFYQTITIDLQGGIHVLWKDSYSNELYYSFSSDGNSWNTSTVGSRGSRPDITVDNTGNLHAVWGRADVFYSKHILVGIEENPERPTHGNSSILHQNLPNPFDLTTTISYGLRDGGHVSITIFDIAGRVINKMDLGYQTAGFHSVKLSLGSLKGERGDAYVGVYFYRLVIRPAGETDGFTATKKMIVVR